jgi:hypothetical protein
LRELRGEEEKKSSWAHFLRRGGEEKLLGAFLEERRVHEVKCLRRSH